MPHFITECSENIRTEADLPGLFQQVNRLLAESGLFPLGGIRSRAHWVDTWQMADGAHDYAFVHMTLKIGHGRTQQQLMPVMEQLFACICEHFADLMARRYLALSLAVEELHPQLNFKQNNVHALFRKE
ncbi:5-carboxymethyl-2-hydroxymuconate delta-isomerase [Jejubacter calystegiae]|uniref:5-carboxymethyl-2-hydroxymuconate delta-isomerase n=1 Tax=Jejubacter calystegiae TaxID=2579935 RepID=A0A4P8YKV8_9ENTR|nr:5-carboxymethyl-2-hydroxymuconate delta-isomerase [Jejubacter calystegiae]QCT20438.1 5-carboxymethyl-2-hydroxymuconate delta-isomerase [Jejubacter calystegiae]